MRGCKGWRIVIGVKYKGGVVSGSSATNTSSKTESTLDNL